MDKTGRWRGGNHKESRGKTITEKDSDRYSEDLQR